MSNRRIEMHEYRQIIYRLQKGQTIRAIAREGLASRDKIKEIKQVAEGLGRNLKSGKFFAGFVAF